MKRVTIDPITRLEGHGKIEIFLDEKGNVKEAFLQVPELRGFERFCEGRRAELMPQITSRICGVCPVAHHMASTKALDACFGVEPPPTAKKLRELLYCGYIIYDHILHFYFLGGPDFIVGPSAPKEKRNILGVIEVVGEDIGKEVIKHRAYGQKITEILGGKATHPVSGIPGGVTKSITEEEKDKIGEMVDSCIDFAKKSLEIFHTIVLRNDKYLDMIKDEAHRLELYNMGLVDEKNQLNFYDGKIRVVSPDGKEVYKFQAKDYLKYIKEKVLEWSYVKVPYLFEIGWKGLQDGADSGIYRVGPLGRLNVSDGLATPLAQEEFEKMYSFFGEKPVSATLAFHWARLIELLYAAERAKELISDPEILKGEIKTKPEKLAGEGVGVVEAARGTLYHHYILNEDATIKKVNLIVATTNNKGAICMSIRNAAKRFIKNGSIEDEGILNQVEMFFRAYDPCFACATHTLNGVEVVIEIKDSAKKLIKRIGWGSNGD